MTLIDTDSPEFVAAVGAITDAQFNARVQRAERERDDAITKLQAVRDQLARSAIRNSRAATEGYDRGWKDRDKYPTPEKK